MPSTSWCRHCGDPIRWVKTRAGKTIPLDESPDPAGNVRLAGGTAEVLGRWDAAERRAAGELLFAPHQATCGPRTKQPSSMPRQARAALDQRKRDRERERIRALLRGNPRRPHG